MTYKTTIGDTSDIDRGTGKSGKQESPLAVYGAIAANCLIAAVKFTVASFTGSSAMLSEGIHSAVDAANDCLLLVGAKRSSRKPDVTHPFGHGKELYFWSLIVAVVLFGVGGGMSIYEGITHIAHPGMIEDPFWNYMVLIAAFVFEGVSLTVSLVQFLPRVDREGIWKTFVTSKDPSLTTIICEDSAAIAGLLIAFLGVYFTHSRNNPVYDGTASVFIGLVLCGVAVFLTRESKSLLIGETADPVIARDILDIMKPYEGIDRQPRILTMQLGAHQILVNMEISFHPRISAQEMIEIIAALERDIRTCHPDIQNVFIEVGFPKADIPAKSG